MQAKPSSDKKHSSKNETDETIHPADELRQTMVAVLWRKEALTVNELNKLTRKEVKSVAGNDFQKLFDKVLKKLLTIKLVEKVNEGKQEKVRIVQRLDV
jgi:hypothetical protein